MTRTSKFMAPAFAAAMSIVPAHAEHADQPKDISRLLAAATTGSAEAELAVGEAFMRGTRGAPVDYPLAIRWLQLASKAGSATAAMDIGRMALEGKGVEQNTQAAIAWGLLAERRGNPLADVLIAHAYETMYPGQDSIRKSLPYWEKAAEGGVQSAQISVAAVYLMGGPVPQNQEKAYFWFKVAAKGPVVAEPTYRGVLSRISPLIARGRTQAELDAWDEKVDAWVSTHRWFDGNDRSAPGSPTPDSSLKRSLDRNPQGFHT